MPLVGYLSTGDPGRISSICRLEGRELIDYRKKIFELVPGVIEKGKVLYVRIYVRDCQEHERGGVTAPVVLKRLVAAGGWEELGKAQCCPLCWVILKKPYDSFPDRMPQAELRVATATQRDALRKGRRTQKEARKPLADTGPVITDIRDMFSGGEEFTTQEVCHQVNLSRTAVLRYLERLLDLGELVQEKGSPGRGNPTNWHIPWKNEA